VDGLGDEPRYGMLETIREFALERLTHSGEGDELRQRHARYFADLSERFGLTVNSPNQRAALARLVADDANLRAAMEGTIERGERALALRFPGALLAYWFVRGHFREGAAWADKALALHGDAPFDHIILAIDTAANLHSLAGEYEQATASAETLLDLARREGDATGEALGLFQLSFIAHHHGEFDAAVDLSEEALARFRALESERWLPWAVTRAGMERLGRGDYDRAEALFREAADLFRIAGDDAAVAMTLCNLGLTRHSQGDIEGAEQLLRDALKRETELDRRWQIVDILLGLADIALSRRKVRRAALLLGAIDDLGETISLPRTGWARDAYDRIMASTRADLGDESFKALWRQGRRLRWSEAVHAALTENAEGAQAPSAPGGPGTAALGLTPRQLEVLRLVAAGQSNRDIAAALFISVPTVKRHISTILSRLELPSRSAATAYAHTHGLV
jgi:ATP/maltotriose-dependent transcriptional regulator MalT